MPFYKVLISVLGCTRIVFLWLKKYIYCISIYIYIYIYIYMTSYQFSNHTAF